MIKDDSSNLITLSLSNTTANYGNIPSNPSSQQAPASPSSYQQPSYRWRGGYAEKEGKGGVVAVVEEDYQLASQHHVQDE